MRGLTKVYLPVQVEHQNQVGEALQQMTPEFFLAAQLALHSALFGDVDERALVANDAAFLDHSGRSVLADGDAAIFSAEPHLAACACGRSGCPILPSDGIRAASTLSASGGRFSNSSLLSYPRICTQRRVDLDQLALRTADVHAFLQGFEQLREALLLARAAG